MSSNDAFQGARCWRRARAVLLHPRFHEGFRDAMAGRPCDYRTFDSLPELDQHRYENGRELAAECRLAGGAVRWPDRTRIPPALKRLVMERVRRRLRGEPAGDPYQGLCPVRPFRFKSAAGPG